MQKRMPDYISQKDWDDVDIPELTDEDFQRMRPAREIAPDIVSAYERGELRTRGPQKAPTKVPITIRLDPDVLDYFKSSGSGWQTRLNDTLRRAIGKD
jgi:uncharacterized protein (DUF4415 family)